MTELSASSTASQDGLTIDAPERTHLVAAVTAVFDDDPHAAALALQNAVDASSWEDVERRVAVAVRALRFDAELESWRGPVDLDVIDDGHEDRWSPLWHDLHAVARLAERGGYPPDVLA